jgi:serine/threonine protein kinase/Flp pilus assembly protein TadD
MRDADHWPQLEQLYHAALERDTTQRAQFIAEACGGDAELRSELESLLAQDLTASNLLDNPAWQGAGSLLVNASGTAPEQQQPTLPAGTIISRYETLEQLGAGGMGVVYKAKDLRLHRMVALKFLTEPQNKQPEALKRFEREARAASALNHPNICTVYDIGEYQNHPFLVLELLEGQTLQSRIQRGPLNIDEILDGGIQIADCLDSAHQKGILHRDIKPANIFITARGQFKVLDFGVAKLHSAEDHRKLSPALTATDSGCILGTAAYMSPEQARGEELDARTDLFSLGAVLYEMATGRPAFSGNTLAMVFGAILHSDPEPVHELVPHLPARVSEIVSRALEKNRQLRYPNALAILTDLKNLKQDLQSSRNQRGEAPIPLYPRFTDSIAVLPFENASGEVSVDYLSEGVAEDIINKLSKLAALRVIARGTAFQYKRAGLDPVQAGRELGVRVVVTGRLSERAGQLVIGAELIDCTEGSQLWGEKYERSLRDVFAVEAEIVQEITNKLRIGFSCAEKEHLVQRPVDNIEAYKLFLKAMYHANRWTPEGIQKGVQFLRQALEADPADPRSYAGLGYVYALRGFFGMTSPREAFPKAKSAALKALEIEENNVSAHLLLANVAMCFDWDWNEAEKRVQTALGLAPNYANCHWAFGTWLRTMGRGEDAIAEMKQAAILDPLSAPISFGLANAYYWARQLDAALKAYKDTIELDPAFVPAYHLLACLYAQKDAYQDALAQLERSLLHHPFDDRDRIARAMVCALSGRVEEARRALAELDQGNAPRYVIAPGFATVHAALGEHEKALNLLEESYQERVSSLMFIPNHPSFEGLYGHPRFKDLLRRIGLPSAATSASTTA